MCKSNIISNKKKILSAGASNLDTLAQLPTACNNSNLKKRARSKWYGNKVIAPLLFIDSPLHKQYQRAYYCNSTLLQRGQTITGKYCNSRICHICNRIRTAKFLNGYGEPLKKLGNLEFITLTVPNCKGDDLSRTITSMTKSFTNILRVIRERRKIKISGIKKVEVTYNEVENTFHPHLHIICDKGVGGCIVVEWLNRYTKATVKAQKVQTADAKSFNELFKYSTKILQKVGKGIDIYIPAIDIIMRALDRRRTFQTFGKIKKVSEDVQELQSITDTTIENIEIQEWNYDDLRHDWYTLDGVKALTGYIPPDIQFTIFV